MIRGACQILILSLVGSSICFADNRSTPDNPVEAARDLVARMVTVRTSSGRFLIVGMDRLAVYDFAHWIEDLAFRYENVTGKRLPEGQAPIIRVYFTEAVGPESSVTVSSRVDGDVLGHSVSIINYQSDIAESVMEMVCYCLTTTVLKQESMQEPDSVSKFEVPLWLTQGIAQNLYPELRKRNSEELLAMWQKGEMLPLKGLLNESGLGAQEKVPRMARGLLVGWMLSFGKDTDFISSVLSAIVSDGRADEADVWKLLVSAGVSDPDRGWDLWMLRQKRTVYLPGETSLQDLAWFKSHMLIYPEDSGIPLSEDIGKHLAPDDLIRLKKNKAVVAALESRFVELQLKAAGKSLEFKRVVDAYCKFISGVIDAKADWRLRGYLEKAQIMLRDFEVETLSARKELPESPGKEAVE